MLNQYREEPRYQYEYKKCPFYLKYQRSDINDKSTPYLLIEYDMTHSHPLGLHIFHY